MTDGKFPFTENAAGNTVKSPCADFPDNSLNYASLLSFLDRLTDTYPFIGVEFFGETLLGRRIPAVVLGEGKTELFYVSGHHGAEWITGVTLLRFLFELCEAASARRRIYGLDSRFLLSQKRLVVIPLLNIDGAELSQNGANPDCPLYERQLRMNAVNGTDFSRWQANARGVDLNHNYSAGWSEYKKIESDSGIAEGAPTKYSGTSPESEPETGALCAYIRARAPRSLLSFHTQGEEIYWSSLGYAPPGARKVAEDMARLTGYRVSTPSGTAAYGGLIDWFISEFDRSAFTLECGKGRNPLPLAAEHGIYLRLRKLLFTFPVMV